MTPHDLDPGRADLSARLRHLGTADDAADGPLAGVTAALTDRVRRRRRNRALGSGAAVASMVAAALVLVPGSPTALLDHATPQPAATTGVGVDGLCGLVLTPEYAATGSAPLGITVSGQRSTVTADETWSADITHGLRPGVDLSALAATPSWDDTELVLVATEGADAGHVVGVGSVPLQRGGSVAASDATVGARAHNATGFVGCDGELVPAGQYRALVVDLVDPGRAAAQGLTGLRGVERTSAALPLTVREPRSTPAGETRPAWLDGTSLFCGMTDDELFRAMPDVVDVPLEVEAVGRPSKGPGAPPTQGLRFTNRGQDPVSLTVGQRPVLAWLDAKTHRVVSFGSDELAATRTLTVEGGDHLEYDVAGYDTIDHCEPAADGTYSERIPAGEYDVVIYTRVPEGTADGSTAFVSRPGVSVHVRSDGTVTLTAEPSTAEAALALTKAGHRPIGLEDSALFCGMSATQFASASRPDAPARLDSVFVPGASPKPGTFLVPRQGKVGTVRTPATVGLAWFTRNPDGTVGTLVSFGPALRAAESVTLTPDGVARSADPSTIDTCAPDEDGSYTTLLPTGDYWVRLYTSVQEPGGERVWITGSDQVGLTVTGEGVVAGS